MLQSSITNVISPADHQPQSAVSTEVSELKSQLDKVRLQQELARQEADRGMVCLCGRWGWGVGDVCLYVYYVWVCV